MGLKTLKSCGEFLTENYEEVLLSSYQHKLNETPP